ncbi:MAG: proliferating cell nuclear antigen (pcna) [archaeon]
MLLKIENNKVLTSIISLISDLVTEVRIKVNTQGLSIIAIDPANVALVSFKLPAKFFSQIEVDEEVIGVSLDSLKNVLRRCYPESTLVMKTEDNILQIEIHDKIKRTFSLALIDIESEEKTEPNLEFTSKIEMGSSDFLEAVEDCIVVADACTFSVLNDKFIIEAKGLNSAKSEFSSDEVRISGENAVSRYSLEYLQKFAKACKIADRSYINFSDDYPLKLEFKTEQFELTFILAPRVETD